MLENNAYCKANDIISGSFKNFILRELSTESAASVLQKLSNMQCKQNNGSRNCQVGRKCSSGTASGCIGSLLKNIEPSTIANDLRRDPIPALSPELLSSTERVFTSLHISCHYLSPEHQNVEDCWLIFQDL